MGIDTYIAMGSNLGDRSANIRAGLDAITHLPTTTIVKCSTIIETDPVGPGEQSCYLNGVVHIQTGLEPGVLLDALLKIEAQLGRDRANEIRWGARTLDLDVLVYGDVIIDEPGLEIPHPRLHTRSFVLVPMCEIAPDLVIPNYKKTPQALLEVLESLG